MTLVNDTGPVRLIARMMADTAGVTEAEAMIYAISAIGIVKTAMRHPEWGQAVAQSITADDSVIEDIMDLVPVQA